MLTCQFGCDLHELIQSRPNTSIYRGVRKADREPVVIKVLDETSPSHRLIAALRNEYSLLQLCAGDGVIRTFGFYEEEGRYGIVMEDYGGEPLNMAQLGGALSIEEFLQIAISLADIIGGVHRQRVVHQDINPGNLLINPETRKLKLIDFGIATVLPDDEQGFGALGALRGTLAYISPEQTGRMNRPIDERTDLYSLGVTLFELVTGVRPFAVEDPLELVHCHLARRPPSPSDLNPAIPQPLSDVILKLLAKNADDRYLTAFGLRADLESCLDQLRRKRSIAPFPLGAHDRADRIHFPRRLYGREAEVRVLVEAFERSLDEASLVLVSGYAGIGKTALIQEVHRPITELRGNFVAGKYDQIQNMPYGGFLQALQALIQLVLTESAEDVALFRERVIDALGANLTVICEACPLLCQIVGPQPPPAPLPSDEARNRFHEAVYSLVALFARPEHPLCMFLDDLQWADADSLKLLKELLHMAKDNALLVLGAYRENEVDDAHPLSMTLREIEGQGSALTAIALAPLSQEDLTQMIADTLRLHTEEVASFAELIFARTAGNPFFVREFITSLWRDGLLKQTEGGWRVDEAEISRQGVTDNVVDLLTSRIERLPARTQRLLQYAACLGNRFDVGTVATVAGQSLEDAGRELWDAVTDGLVIPVDRVGSALEASAAPQARFRFAHDRIQQAALASLDEEGLMVLSRDVGRRWLGSLTTEEQRDQWLFEVTGQLNRGRAAIVDPKELDELRTLNLKAARKALVAGAAEPAVRYARMGIALLTDEDWERKRDLARDLHDVGIEAAFGCADIEAVQALSAVLLKHARTPLEEARVRRVEGKVLYAQTRVAEAIDTFADLVGRLGFPLPSPNAPESVTEEMMRTEAVLAGRAIEDLADLPRCTDEAAIAALEVLSRMTLLALSVSHPLFVPVLCKAVQISVTYGNTAESAFAYTYYGTVLAAGNDFDRAARMGRVALTLADRFGDTGVRAIVYLYAYFNLIHHKQPLQEIEPFFLDAYRYGVEAGSPYPAATALTSWCIIRFNSGKPLLELAADMVRARAVSDRFRQPVVSGWLDPWHQAVHNLTTETRDPAVLEGPFYDEKARLATDHGEGGSRANYHLVKTMLCYLFADLAGAVLQARAGIAYAAISSTAAGWAPRAMWESLALLGAYERADDAERATILETVTASAARLEAALPHCPKTISHKLALVQGEKARVEGRTAAARAHFEAAVDHASKSGYWNEEALAHEVTGRFYLCQRDLRAARGHFREAHATYIRWGAVVKAQALENELPHLLPRVASVALNTITLTGTGSGNWDVNVLDLISVINASQAISREIDPDKLVARLMSVLIETGGAQSGVLLRESEGKWFVRAEKAIDDVAATVYRSGDLPDLVGSNVGGVAQSIVNYVARTEEPLLLDDATGHPQFRRDPHVAKNQTASVLCFPLPSLGGGRGIVYLENNLMKGAFAPGRIKILLLLSTQAVISLDNAELYRTLERRVEERTRALSAKNEELSVTLEKLHQAQDRMIMQDRLASLGSLTAGVAHELRNPLNFVNNFAEASVGLIEEARENAGDPEEIMGILKELEGNAGCILDSGRRMDKIIRSMLAHSRGGQGEREEVELNGIVKEFATFAIHGLRSRTPPIDVTFELSLDPDVGSLRVVPQEVSRVLLNLVDNAGHAVNEKRQASPAGYVPTVRVTTRSLGDQVEIRVFDNGVGIPLAIRDRIFNPFFTTKRTGEGTGLGLSICYDIIVKSYRGSVAFESKSGEFTEFVVTLPRKPNS